MTFKYDFAMTCLAVCLLAGCGLDENYTSLGDGALPGEPLNPIDRQVECTGVEACTADPGSNLPEPVDLTGRAYRLDSLELMGPLDGLLLEMANDKFVEQLAADELNVLLQVVTDDREFDTLDMEIGGGAPLEQGYEFQGDRSPLFCSLTGPVFKTLQASALTFPTDLVNPPELPISNLKLSGSFSQDGSAVESGVLDGVLTRDDAGEVSLGGPLDEMLEGSGIPADVDLDGDGEADGWRFVFHFTAAPIEVLD